MFVDGLRGSKYKTGINYPIKNQQGLKGQETCSKERKGKMIKFLANLLKRMYRKKQKDEANNVNKNIEVEVIEDGTICIRSDKKLETPDILKIIGSFLEEENKKEK